MNCCNCNEPPAANQVLYHVLDMGPDVICVIEEWRNEEVHDGDTLCQNCLERILHELDRRIGEVSTDVNVVRVPGIAASEPVLIRGRIKSRHHSRTLYYTYILLDTVSNDWQESICAYYCSCIIDKRTVGSCAHVVTIVWYLGWARYQDNISPPAPYLDGILVREDFD